jgi:hypothetical protein
VGRETVLDGDLGKLGLRPPAPRLVDRHAGGDREHPRAQMPPVAEPRVRAQCAQERFLERVVRRVADQAAQVCEHRVPVLGVEELERRHAHGFHCPLKRSRGRGREMWRKRVAKWGYVV